MKLKEILYKVAIEVVKGSTELDINKIEFDSRKVNENDIFIAISTSGNSNNVIDAINAAKEKGIKTVAFTGGTGGKLSNICECIIVPSSSTEKIQEVHIMLGHILCYLIENKIFKI
jgi:D-arabinose 5-phosphate isomerase GutQ